MLSLFCEKLVSKSNRQNQFGQRLILRVLSSTKFAQGRLLCTQHCYRIAGLIPSRRCVTHQRIWTSARNGSTSICHYQAPTTLTPSNNASLGKTRHHKELHRCARRRSFNLAFSNKYPTRILHHLGTIIL